MRQIPESFFEKVLYSLKLESWPKVIVPYLFSLALVLYSIDYFLFGGAVLGLLYVVFLVLYIVLMNDYADAEIDRIKRAMFPENCSPKTIPDNILSEYQVLGGGLFSIFMLLCLGVISYFFFYSTSLSGILLSIAVFWMYSLHPFRLNYRGGGEILEAIGISILIPFTIFQFFGSSLQKSDFIWLIPSFFLSFSSAIASGLSDESSDKIGGKRTIVTVFGLKNALRLLVCSYSLGIGIFAGVLLLKVTWFNFGASVILVLSGIFTTYKLFGFSSQISTNSFAEISLLKSFLHKGIWYTTLFVALLLLGLKAS